MLLKPNFLIFDIA